MTVRSYTSAEKCIRSLQKKVATKFRPDKTGKNPQLYALVTDKNCALIPFLLSHETGTMLEGIAVRVNTQVNDLEEWKSNFAGTPIVKAVVPSWEEALDSLARMCKGR